MGAKIAVMALIVAPSKALVLKCAAHFRDAFAASGLRDALDCPWLSRRLGLSANFFTSAARTLDHGLGISFDRSSGFLG